MSKPEILNIGFKISVEELWKLKIETQEISILQLENNLDIPYLENEGTDDWNLTPRELINNFDTEISHNKKVLLADLNYPIEIYHNKGEWIILDGVHRFVKSINLGLKKINVRKVSEDDLKNI